MNPDLDKLQPYPFERLAQLKAGITPPAELNHIPLSIGEPRHPAPQRVVDALIGAMSGVSSYPLTRGTPELRTAIANWLTRRFKLPDGSIDPARHVLPVNGTREALFAFAQAVVDRDQPNPLVVSPNPFYQIYEGAALLAGATPHFINTVAENGFIPDFAAVPADVWADTQLVYLCSPGNPTGAVIGEADLGLLLDLAEEHDFIIASDECYSEIYFDEAKPPVGLLEVAAKRGNTEYRRCAVFHSLSKRSNLPGLRSGFVAGDASIMDRFFKYRTYHGCAMPPATQLASIAAWDDEQHTVDNRALYKTKFDAVLDIIGDVIDVQRPAASFYLWPQTPIDEQDFARELFARQNVTVVPGSYLSRDTASGNPGSHRVRMALVATLDECVEAAQRLRRFIETL